MTTNYPIGDYIIRVKNAALARRKDLEVPRTRLIFDMAQALERAGFIEEVTKDDLKVKARISYKNKRPIIMGAKLISKPGLRIYMGADELDKKKGPSVFFLSSPKGVISSREAVKQRVGGEVIAEIW